MSKITPGSRLVEAIHQNDVNTVRHILLDNMPYFRGEDDWLNYIFRDAARDNYVVSLPILTEYGADVNTPDKILGIPEGPIANAATKGSLDSVHWLLAHGAKVNYIVKGQERCQALTGAARNGHLEIVKLLIEAGASITASWAGENALSQSIDYGQSAVETYLRSIGMKLPNEISSINEQENDQFIAHLRKYIGEPAVLHVHNKQVNDAKCIINAVRTNQYIALVSRTHDDIPVIKHNNISTFVEYVIYLPLNWPLSTESLTHSDNVWPMVWLKRIKKQTQQLGTWKGEPALIFTNDEPPRPLASNTKLSCILAIKEDSELATLQLINNKQIVFYSLYPLYSEEREYEQRNGIEALLERFMKYDIDTTVNIARNNVAL